MLKRMFTGWRLLFTLVVLAVAGVLVSLGFWQLDRLNQRLALNARINAGMAAPPIALNPPMVDAATLDYRRVVVRGTFDHTQEILLRNRAYNEATGYHIITPLKISGSDQAVLVDRGWVPLEQGTPAARAALQVRGEVTIDGVARRSQEVATGPQDPPLSAERPRLDAWFQVNIPRIQRQVGYPLLPVFVDQQPASDVPPPGPPTSLPVPTSTRDLGPGSNLNYALQWFSFAVILLVGYGAVTYQHARGDKETGDRRQDDTMTR